MTAIIDPEFTGVPFDDNSHTVCACDECWDALADLAVAEGVSGRPTLVVLEGGEFAALRRRQPATVYRRRRLVAAAVVALVAALAVFGTRALLPAGAESISVPAAAVEASTTTVVVARPGDSLWTIARRVQPEGDVRQLVSVMASTNGGSSVQAGQRVIVPAD